MIISKTGKNNLEIKSIESDCRHISFKVIPIHKGGKYSIEAVLSDKAPTGTIRGTARIHTNNAEQKIIDVPIYALITD